MLYGFAACTHCRLAIVLAIITQQANLILLLVKSHCVLFNLHDTPHSGQKSGQPNIVYHMCFIIWHALSEEGASAIFSCDLQAARGCLTWGVNILVENHHYLEGYPTINWGQFGVDLDTRLSDCLQGAWWKWCRWCWRWLPSKRGMGF